VSGEAGPRVVSVVRPWGLRGLRPASPAGVPVYRYDPVRQVALTCDGEPPLWAEIERAYQQWRGWGEPGWDRVGLTVSPEAWTVWLDEPHNIICWASPSD